MVYSSPNPAENCTPASAEAMRSKLVRLGFVGVGQLYLNPNGTAQAVDYTLASDVTLDANGSYAFLIPVGGDWHNAARLIQMYGTGTLTEFQRVATDIGVDPLAASLAIPGAAQAIERVIAIA